MTKLKLNDLGTEYVCFDEEGQFHNDNGPCIVSEGNVFYCHHGTAHNFNGPAWIEKDGSKTYALNGILHNSSGPAVIHSDGTVEYYVFGMKVNEEVIGHIQEFYHQVSLIENLSHQNN